MHSSSDSHIIPKNSRSESKKNGKIGMAAHMLDDGIEQIIFADNQLITDAFLTQQTLAQREACAAKTGFAKTHVKLV